MYVVPACNHEINDDASLQCMNVSRANISCSVSLRYNLILACSDIYTCIENMFINKLKANRFLNT